MALLLSKTGVLDTVQVSLCVTVATPINFQQFNMSLVHLHYTYKYMLSDYK